MKHLSETKALEKLAAIKTTFARHVRDEFEHKAKSCVTCKTPGACCLDEHFVNVHVTRLEAVAIRRKLDGLNNKREVYRRIDDAIEKYELTGSGETYACPLFEKGIGCLVHGDTKPLACIAHACYERSEDLPPGELLAEREIEVDNLNEKVYGRTNWLPLPVAIRNLSRSLQFPAENRHRNQKEQK